VIWEESQGIVHSYGYNRNEKLADYKTSHDLILMLVDIVSRGGNLLLDIGPTADGRIPVIMQQRLADIGHWLKINGEAIYETEAYTPSYQWSKGIRRQKSGKNYMAGYSVTQLIKPQKDTAYVEAFFTRKGKDLFCILPKYMPKFKLRDRHIKTNTTATVLGNGKAITWRNSGKDAIVDLSGLKPGDASPELLVIKLENAL
jgi:alpha-L-fucosidase